MRLENVVPALRITRPVHDEISATEPSERHRIGRSERIRDWRLGVRWGASDQGDREYQQRWDVPHPIL